MPLFRPRIVLLHFFFQIGSTGMMKCVYKCLAHEDILYVLWFGGLLGCHGLLCLWRSFASRKSVERSMIGTKLQSALGSLETPEFWWTPTASSRNTDWRQFGETGALKKHVHVCILIFPITIGLAFGIRTFFFFPCLICSRKPSKRDLYRYMYPRNLQQDPPNGPLFNGCSKPLPISWGSVGKVPFSFSKNIVV